MQFKTFTMTEKIKWTIDPLHSEIAFKIRHLMIANVRGVFRKFEAEVYTTGIDFSTAEINFRIQADSIDTNNDHRDDHLKGADFFDSAKHRNIVFISEKIEASENNRSFALYGELTMRGISKRIKLDVESGGMIKDPYGKEKAGFTVTGKLNRKDWEIAWNQALEAGGAMLSDDVHIQCEVELVMVEGETEKTKQHEEEDHKN
jgi:polyisoprenoid-binding protein YceI